MVCFVYIYILCHLNFGTKWLQCCSGRFYFMDIITFSMENEKMLLRWDSNPQHAANALPTVLAM